MDDTFVLKIQLGNDAMQTGFDVAQALRATADQLDVRGQMSAGDYGYVVDGNGNSAGSWEVQ